MQEWFTAEDLAEMALPGMPLTKRNINELAERRNWRRAEQEYPANPKGWWRKREGRGGGFEYRLNVLPSRAQTALALRMARSNEAERPKQDASQAWTDLEAAPDRKKDAARTRFEALDAVDLMVRAGTQRDMAMMTVANRSNIALRTLYGWAALVAGRPKGDWLPLLMPRHKGRQIEAECPEEAFDALKEDFLRLAQPSFQSCYRRVAMAAKEQGWVLPSARTLERRIYAETPPAVMILAREGLEALKRKYPAQRRVRTEFRALEAVNADGHKFDVFVKTPDGRVIRPTMVAFQDLHSGKILSYRLAESEHRGTVMLAFGDIVEAYGIPEHCWLDNGRSFASKWLTGQIPNRYRFKVKEDEIEGILKVLHVDVHWTQPYSGQSKPIERAFRDLCDTIAKHPAFEGAYTGNNPMAKPENYGSRAIPWADFEAVLADGIAEHNAREGRRSQVCRGRFSFDQAFKASYESGETLIRRATSEQRRLWLMAAESVMVRSADAMIHFMGNRYWAEFALGLTGQRVTVRFDPDQLHDGLHVYANGGRYLGLMPCIEDTGFANQDAARAHMQARKAWLRASREQLDAEKRMGIDAYVAMLPKSEAAPAPEPTKVVRPVFGNLALKADPSPEPVREATIDVFARGVLATFPTPTRRGQHE